MSELGRIFPLRGQDDRHGSELEPLWREVLGSRLRALRAEREETLAQTAERAGISPQYLSEIERGRKEASSEMIAALAGALDISVADLMASTAEELRAATLILSGPVIRTANPLGPPPSQRPAGPAGPVALAMAA
jgi:transcriptional regulator with XRE-family HTH domain